MRRCWAEAQAVARLNHPNIVAVYDVGETDDQTYLVMELVEGNSLRDLRTPAHAPGAGDRPAGVPARWSRPMPWASSTVT